MPIEDSESQEMRQIEMAAQRIADWGEEAGDSRQILSLHEQLEEMMTDQEYADRSVLNRVRRGETTHQDYLYLVGRLNYSMNDLEK